MNFIDSKFVKEISEITNNMGSIVCSNDKLFKKC